MPVFASPTVRLLEESDLPFAAKLHEAALPHGFFARLGQRFLRVYYRGYVRSPYAVALLAESPGQPPRPLGALVGTFDTAAHNRWLLRHEGARLALAGSLALLSRPRELALFLRTRVRRYLRAVARTRTAGPVGTGAGAGAGAVAVPARPPAVLTHVAVADSARGGGAGRALVDAFARAAREAGCPEAQLVTLVEPGAGAAQFYEQLGWTAVWDRSDHDGRRTRLYRVQL